jgi:hypothetical protein
MLRCFDMFIVCMCRYSDKQVEVEYANVLKGYQAKVVPSQQILLHINLNGFKV